MGNTTIPMGRSAFTDSDDTCIYWLGGAGFLIHSHRTNILLDPVLMTDPANEKRSEAGLPLKIRLPISAEEVPGTSRMDRSEVVPRTSKADRSEEVIGTIGAAYSGEAPGAETPGLPEEITHSSTNDEDTGCSRDPLVLYTHTDKDHLGSLTAQCLGRKGFRMTGTLAVFEKLARLKIPVEKIGVLRIYEKMRYGDVIIEATAADHPWQLKDLKRGGRSFRIGECCGFIITVPEGRMFFPGDTRLMEEHLRIENIDLLALDVSTDEFHIGHTCGPVLANQFPKAAILPFHYGTYDCPDIAAHVGEPEDVYPLISGIERRGYVLSPGERFSFSEFMNQMCVI